MQQVVQTDKTMTQLPQELWTHILSYVPYAELWYACRLVSRAFHKDRNFILRNQYVSKEISIISSNNYMSFSHFNAANMACFRPSDIPGLDQETLEGQGVSRLAIRQGTAHHHTTAPPRRACAQITFPDWIHAPTQVPVDRQESSRRPGWKRGCKSRLTRDVRKVYGSL
jgi:hypothetical protein